VAVIVEKLSEQEKALIREIVQLSHRCDRQQEYLRLVGYVALALAALFTSWCVMTVIGWLS
jgi:hypothetical protein